MGWEGQVSTQRLSWYNRPYILRVYQYSSK